MTDGENALLRLYRQYIGDPDSETDVYAGFGLFFTGIGLGVVGVAVFLYSSTLPTNELSTYAVREVAVVASALGLPAILSAVVVLLPVDRRTLYVAAAGSAVCVAAIGLFVWAYPHAWNVTNPPDYSAQGVAVYSLGLVSVVGATGTALVAHQVERAQGGPTGADSPTGDAAADGPDVTDEQVRADIDRELDNAEISWGGVEKREGRRLELDTSAIDDVERTNIADSATKTRAGGDDVDSAVSQLRGLQGGNVETQSGSGTDDQAAALQELREQQRRTAEQKPDGVLGRVRAALDDRL